MNRTKIITGILSIALGCGGAGVGGGGEPSTTGGENDPEAYELCSDTDGTRIEFVRTATADGETRVGAIYDTRLGTCYIDSYPDNNGIDRTACIPLSNGGDIYFADDSCQTPLAHFSDERFVKPYIQPALSDGLGTSLYRVGAPLAASPQNVYLPSPRGCVLATLPTSGVFLESPGRMDVSEMVTFEESNLVVGSLAQQVLQGQDGSTVCNKVVYQDSQLNSECQFLSKSNDNRDALACYPTGVADVFSRFSSDTCDSERLFGFDRGATTNPQYGSHTTLGECSTVRDTYEMVAEPNETFRLNTEGVCISGGTSPYKVGALVDESLFQVGEFFIRPDSVGRIKRGYYRTQGGLLVDRGSWWDSKLETKCVVTAFPSDGSFRCTPVGSGRVESVYTDSECTTEVDAVVADLCDGAAPIKFGTQRSEERDRFWELAPRTAPAFHFTRVPGSTEPACTEYEESVFDLAVEISIDSLGLVEQTTPTVQGE